MSIIQKLALRLLSPASRQAIAIETTLTTKETIERAIYGIVQKYSFSGGRETTVRTVSTIVRRSDVDGQTNTMAADKKARLAITEQYCEFSKVDLAAVIALGRAYNAS